MGDLWVTPIVVRGLSVGYACCPWVTPVGFTHGCVLVTALRFLLPMMFVISDARAVRPYLLMEWAAGAKVGHSFIHVAEYSLAIPNITLYLCPKISMHIISRSTLVAYYERNPQLKVALEDWFNKTPGHHGPALLTLNKRSIALITLEINIMYLT